MFLLSLLSIKISAQDLMIGYRTINNEKNASVYKFYDTLGKELFSLPENHVPVFKPILKKSRDKDSFEQNNSPVLLVEQEAIFFIEPNEPSILIGPEKHLENELKFAPYLINRAGNKIKEFPLFELTSPLFDSIFIGYRRVENGYMLRYVDYLGNELFDGQEFWEATPFVDGIAVVQKKDENDDWVVINKKEQIILNISKTSGLKIENVIEFHEGNAIIIESKSEKQFEEYYKNIEEIASESDREIDEAEMAENGINWLFNLLRGSNSYRKNIYWMNIKGEFKPFPNQRSLGTELYERQHNLLNKNFEISNEFKSKLAQSKYLGLIADSIITNDIGYYLLWETPENSITSELVLYDHNGHKILLKGLEDGRIISVKDRMLIVGKELKIFIYDLENTNILENDYFADITRKNFRYYGIGLSKDGFFLKVYNRNGQLETLVPTSTIAELRTSQLEKKDSVIFDMNKKFPDPAFEKVVKERYPDCFDMNGNININCKGIMDETSLVLHFKGIKSLDGIQFFKNLESLVISGNNIEELSKYPPKLKKLFIKSNRAVIKKLILPASLTHFEIFESYSAITINLPPQLKFLDISDEVKINGFPNNLDTLYLSTDLKTIPKLPSNLKFLDIQYINLTILQNLPNSIQTLHCNAENIVNLPSNLKELYCKTSKINGLPKSLEKLTIEKVDDIKDNYGNGYAEIIGPLPINLTSMTVKLDFLKFANDLPESLKYLHWDHFPECYGLNQGLETFISNNLMRDKFIKLPSSLKSLNLENGGSLVVPKFPPNLEYLNLDGFRIYSDVNLSGLRTDSEFDLGVLPSSLKYLNISGTNLKLPSILPENLTYLKCSGTKLSALPKVPNRLDSLICSHNELFEIKDLPYNLKYLDCKSNDSLNSLSALPSSLEEFYVSECNLKKIPELPSKLRVLDCNRNQITILTNLPSTLTHLNCSGNKLESLPSLSNGLKELNISWNRISKIERLPNTITNFQAENNTLIRIPNIPDSLIFMNVNSNHLKELPKLNLRINTIFVSNNALSNLPTLPASLTSLDITYNCFDSLYISEITNKPIYFISNVVPILCDGLNQISNSRFTNYKSENNYMVIDITNIPFGAKIQIMPVDKDYLIFEEIKYKNYILPHLVSGEYRMFIDSKLYKLTITD